jgi:hypothetical protein
MATGVTAAAMVMLRLLLAVRADGAVESVACKVNVAVPAAVGVPPIWPVAAFKVKPPGSAPELTDHEYGVVPPVADKVVE